jgi:hypothetical protein
LDDRVALARNRLDERGLAASIGTEDSNVFAGVHGEIDVVKDDIVATRYVDMRQV